MPPLLQRLIACGALTALPASTAAAQIDAFWNSAADGSWTTASNWSVDPAVPFNGFPNPLDRYHAWINTTGSPYTVMLDFNIEIDDLTLDSADATVHHTANQLNLNGGTLDLRAGHYLLDGGTLANMTVTSSGGTIGFGTGDHTFDGITFEQIDLNIAAGQTISAPNDLVINSGNVFMGEGEGGAIAELATSGLDGNATYRLNYARLSGGQIEISRNIIVRTASATFNEIEAGTLINRGSIIADIDGGRIRLDGGTALNTALGEIRAVNGATIDGRIDNRGQVFVGTGSEMTLTLAGNTGTITAEPGAQLAFNYIGGATASGMGTLNVQGASVRFGGSLDLQNTSYDLGGADWIFYADGQISNGTITDTLGGSLRVDYSDVAFSNVTLDRDMVVGPTARVTAPGGIEVTAGHAIVLQRTGDAGHNYQPWFTTSSLTGAGELRFERDQVISGNPGALFGENGTLVIGSDFTVRTESAHGSLSANLITNLGTIHAHNPYTLSGGFGTLDNQGTLRASQAGVLDLTNLAAFTNTGHLEANTFGAIYLDGNWSNTGTIHIDQATLRLNGQFDTAQLNGLTLNNAQVRLIGELDATTAPLVIDGNDNSNWILGGLPSESPEATFRGALTTINSGRMIVTDNAVFDQLALDGRIDAIDASRVRFLGDTVLTNGAEIHFQPNVATEVRFAEVQSILGDGDLVFDTPNSPTQVSLFNTGELTLGSGVTLRTGTGSGRVHSGILNNQGTILAQGNGNRIHLDLQVNNTGAIEARNGGVIQLDPNNLNSTGSILLDNGTLRVTNVFTVDDLPDYSSQNNGHLEVIGDMDLLGQTWQTSGVEGGLALRDGGTVRNGLVDATAGPAIRISHGVGKIYAAFAGELQVHNEAVAQLFNPAPFNGQVIRLIADDDFATVSLHAHTISTGNAEVRFEGAGKTYFYSNSIHGPFDLGSGMTLRALGGEARVGLPGVTTINNGTIRAENPGAVIRLLTKNVGTNIGLIESFADTAIAFEGSWSNEGTIRIATSNTQTTVEDDLTLQAAGTLRVDWDASTQPGQAPLLDIGEDLTLGGTLDLVTAKGYTPERGDTLLLSDARNTFGTFDAVTLDGSAASDLFVLTQGRRTSVYFAFLGDATLDSFVGVEDLDLILANWGASVTPGNWSQGDLNADGSVGQADLQIVLTHWGESTAPPNTNVPEPGSLALLALTGIALHRRKRSA
ncbi:MAG: PEP-CTERM sorting domain-containing protein [Planctomycetota bacterium]